MTCKLNLDKVANSGGTVKEPARQEFSLLNDVVSERIRQARLSATQAYWSFLAAILITTASATISLTWTSLVLLGKASEDTITGALGLASGIYSYQLSKDAEDRQRQRQASTQLAQMLLELQENSGRHNL